MFSGASFKDVKLYSLQLHGDDWLSENFQVKEFRCHDGSDIILIHPLLVHGLQTIRLQIDEPLFLSNAYRSHLHNINVGGFPKSKHKWGMASDMATMGLLPQEIQSLAKELGFGGVGSYANFTHVDVYGNNRRW